MDAFPPFLRGVFADAVDGQAPGQPIKPGAEQPWILQPADGLERLEPHFLEHVQGLVFIVHQLLGKVEQRPLQFADKIAEGRRLAVLAAEGDPLISCLSACAHLHTSRSWPANGSRNSSHGFDILTVRGNSKSICDYKGRVSSKRDSREGRIRRTNPGK